MATQPVCVKKAPYILELEAGTYWWCSCGKSADQPFCDGSHENTDFSPVKFELKEKTKVKLCGCKHTQDAPHCDATHKGL